MSEWRVEDLCAGPLELRNIWFCFIWGICSLCDQSSSSSVPVHPTDQSRPTRPLTGDGLEAQCPQACPLLQSWGPWFSDLKD